jgi:signal transduction histidine kinase
MALVHPDDQAALRAAVARAWEDRGTWSATYRLRLADGGWRWFRGRGRTERDAQGRLRMSGMIGDVHQQELDRRELDRHRHHLRAMVAERTDALNAALEEARDQRRQAERASNAKSEFLAHMSHELRTPLNGLLGLTGLALQSAEQPAQRRYLEVALRSGRGLLQVIDEVLDLSRLEAGGVELAHQPFDLAELLADVMRTLMPGASGKPLSLRYDYVGEPTRVLGDAARVRQVTTNLLANAIKFTARGHVTLTCEVAQDDGSGLRATVRVEDSGPGIAPALHERIFEPFVQADASLTRQHGGSGLGLAIARRMANAMGGEVKLEGSSAAGSAFAFSWPLAADTPVLPRPQPGPGHAWLVFRRRDSGHWLQRRIERLGWTAEQWPDVAAVAIQARMSVPVAHPQLLFISDQALDAQTDFAALRAALPAARVVLLVRPDWHQPALERAAAAHRIEPALLPLTPGTLRDLLAAPAASPPLATSPPVSAAKTARVLVVEDNAVNLMITEEFVRQLGHEPHGAADGAAAIAACERQPPQLVLMDLQMPLMDGFEATRRLRELQSQGRLPRFPIIALTAHAGEADRRQGSAVGMDDYLTKPILIDALRASLVRWLG